MTSTNLLLTLPFTLLYYALLAVGGGLLIFWAIKRRSLALFMLAAAMVLWPFCAWILTTGFFFLFNRTQSMAAILLFTQALQLARGGLVAAAAILTVRMVRRGIPGESVPSPSAPRDPGDVVPMRDAPR